MSGDEAVEFDGIVDRVAAAAVEVARDGVDGARCAGTGTFGVLPAEIATSLVMVLNELLLNAVEHGFAGRAARRSRPEVVVSAHRFRKQLHVTVADNGRGLPDGLRRSTAASGSGCRSSGRWPPGSCAARSSCAPGPSGGTEAVLVVPLAKVEGGPRGTVAYR